MGSEPHVAEVSTSCSGPRGGVVPLGVGDAFSARWYSPCLLVEASGDARLPAELHEKLRLIQYPDDFDRAASVSWSRCCFAAPSKSRVRRR